MLPESIYRTYPSQSTERARSPAQELALEGDDMESQRLPNNPVRTTPQILVQGYLTYNKTQPPRTLP
jgi:hypothetical protein